MRSNDLARTGANLSETILTPANVNSANFGKLYTVPTDAQVYAQPLYVSGLQIGGAAHDVVFVASMRNTVYAIDAPSGAILWQNNFGTAMTPQEVQVDQNIAWNTGIGILGTPVIDPSTKYMFFVSANERVDSGANIYEFHLNAIDITTGQPVLGSPVLITATYRTADLLGAPLTFLSKRQNQRPGLVLANGNVYIAFGSHNDLPGYTGWVMAYSATTLQQTAVYSSTTLGSKGGGIWNAGQAPSVDAAGNLYLSTGNGAFGPTAHNLIQTGNSFIKLSPSLELLDYFTPHNSAALSAGDQDLGSSGLLLIPDTNYILGGGKEGILYLVDRAAMGQFNSATDQVRQEFQAIYGKGTSHIHGSPTYFNSATNGPTTYVWGENDVLRGLLFNNMTGLINTTPFAMSTMTAPVTNNNGSMPGGFTSISANGMTNGIVWASTPFNGNAMKTPVPGVLYAFDANTLALLWSDKTQDARDEVGIFAKYAPPTIANGRLFVPTFGSLNHADGTGQLVAYGLVNKLMVNVTNATMTAGSAIPTFAGTVAGILAPDTLGGTIVVTYSTAATSASPAGTYPITATVTGSSASNYSVTVNTGTLTVSSAPVPLTVNVANASMTAGAALPPLTGTATGIQAPDTLGGTVIVTYSTTATSASPAGAYPIAATVTGSSASNYIITINAGTLTVSNAPVPLTVNVANASTTVGAAIPILAGTVTGIQASDTLGSTVIVTYSTTATNTSPVGTYPITAVVSGVSASNYSVVVIPGSLAISAPLLSAGTVSYPAGFAGSTMQLNGTAALQGPLLRLVNGGKNQTASAFYPAQVNVQGFKSAFTFQLTSANADGMAFVIQGVGPTALGGGTSSLGVGPTPGKTTGSIVKSVAIKFDLYNNNGEGPNSTGLYLKGASPRTPFVNLVGTGIDLHRGNPITASLNYNGVALNVSLTDTITGGIATQTYLVNIPATVGSSTAFVGFTAASGSTTVTADVLKWTFAPQAVLIYPTGSLSAKSSGPAFSALKWTGFPDGLGMLLNSAKVGDQVVMTVNVPAAGVYNIAVTSKQFNTRGIFQLSVDGTAVGLQSDEYDNSNSAGVLKSFDLGTVSLGAGNHNFTFTLAAQHTGSLGSSIDFGQLVLTAQ